MLLWLTFLKSNVLMTPPSGPSNRDKGCKNTLIFLICLQTFIVYKWYKFACIFYQSYIFAFQKIYEFWIICWNRWNRFRPQYSGHTERSWLIFQCSTNGRKRKHFGGNVIGLCDCFMLLICRSSFAYLAIIINQSIDLESLLEEMETRKKKQDEWVIACLKKSSRLLHFTCVCLNIKIRFLT